MFLQKTKPHSKMLLRGFAFVCSLIMLLSVLPAQVQANNDKKSRSISIVYDDSGSMIKNGNPPVFNDRWCQAKYAMEVFAAMLDTEDVMNIFPMSLSSSKKPFLTIRGSESAEPSCQDHGSGSIPSWRRWLRDRAQFRRGRTHRARSHSVRGSSAHTRTSPFCSLRTP